MRSTRQTTKTRLGKPVDCHDSSTHAFNSFPLARMIFRLFDRDGSGEIGVEELGDAIVSSLSRACACSLLTLAPD